jgi:hypothetical protein
MTVPVCVDPTVLLDVLERARSLGPRGVVVFDLDSTLLDNRPRQARILREYGEAHGLPALAAARPEHWAGWDLRSAMAATGLLPPLIDLHVEPAKEFWRARFFTSEYCAVDEAIPGARAYLERVHQTGVELTYCTGRHEPMRAGTVSSFARLGLPLPGEHVHLLMKPTFELGDDEWKQVAYERLRALGEVIAVFDNEPTHVNGYRHAFPDALCVHVATDDSGRPVPLSDGVVSVRDLTLRVK